MLLSREKNDGCPHGWMLDDVRLCGWAAEGWRTKERSVSVPTGAAVAALPENEENRLPERGMYPWHWVILVAML
jgi:hypothetical protein